ncbi:hypothetical protein OG244_02705 [Streptomyces brevispora]|uniref:hypothetical protein n=1 Tax=Streptomyces brevispora TaxID=887462 RepID=UPI002E32D52B|nr:hypothetical protein [Streptomyces brevispora]
MSAHDGGRDHRRGDGQRARTPRSSARPARRGEPSVRSTPLPRTAAAELGAVLRPAGPEHPWWGREFSAGWGTKESLAFQPVVPDLVAEVDTDTALDLGRHRHPVRYLRLRDDMDAGDVRE